ncbi:membrane-associated protein, putative, partial [Bodo saltans]
MLKLVINSAIVTHFFFFVHAVCFSQDDQDMSGRYVPPQRRVASGGSRKDASSFQRETFSALKRTFTGLANRVSFDNVQNVAVEVFRENVVRGRGLFCDALLRTQQFNPEVTQVFAALVAIVNRKIPRVGLLMLKRLVVGWRQRYRRRDWNGVRNVNIFVGHLYCMNVCSEGIVLAIIDEHLKDLSCTDHDVDLAIAEIDVVFRVMMER